MEMSEEVYDGEPVFPDYLDERHCPRAHRSSPVNPRTGDPVIVAGSRYVGGWDAGNTLSPAFVLLQVTPGNQVHCLFEVVPERPEAIGIFSEGVMLAIQKVIPYSWSKVHHVGDATIVNRNGHTGETAQQVAKRTSGIMIHALSNSWHPRVSAVTRLLTEMIDADTPRFMLYGATCRVLRKGFMGNYKFEQSARGDERGAGRILQTPLKNSYSHVHDAFQMAALHVVKIMDTGGEQFTARRRIQTW
jgi:hypothetical protein